MSNCRKTEPAEQADENGVAATSRRHSSQPVFETWKYEPAATWRRTPFSLACQGGAGSISAPLLKALGNPLKKAALIYNPIAGRRPARREREIRQAAGVLYGAGIDAELAPTARPGEATSLAQAAVGSAKDLILVCGGDGTINEVINGLAPREIPLGILPGGTANILARELRLPGGPVAAARRLASWSPRRIALGRARWGKGVSLPAGGISAIPGEYRYYATVAGVGFDAHIVYKLSLQLKMGLGVAGYALEAFRQLVRYGFPRFSWRTNGQERLATFATVHRTQLYAGWLHLAPSAGLFRPHLVVCSFPSPSRARYLLYALAVLARQHLRLGDVTVERSTQVFCAPPHTSHSVRFELDGELAGVLPATFEVVPDALTLLVP